MKNLTWKLRHCLLSSQISRQVWQPASWTFNTLHLNQNFETIWVNTNHPDDHLAKLFQILVVTLIQETELRCFRALRANASEIFIFQQFKEVILGNVKSWLTLHSTLGNDCSCSSRPWEESYKSYKRKGQLKDFKTLQFSPFSFFWKIFSTKFPPQVWEAANCSNS